MLPVGLPDLFIDRSLGRVKVPTILRAAGIQLTTLAEHYGVPMDQAIADVTWLQECANQGWSAFMKDAAIATNPAEIAVVRACNIKCFALTKASLPAHRMAGWFLNNLDRIALACANPGPFVYGVDEDRIRVLA